MGDAEAAKWETGKKQAELKAAIELFKNRLTGEEPNTGGFSYGAGDLPKHLPTIEKAFGELHAQVKALVKNQAYPDKIKVIPSFKEGFAEAKNAKDPEARFPNEAMHEQTQELFKFVLSTTNGLGKVESALILKAVKVPAEKEAEIVLTLEHVLDTYKNEIIEAAIEDWYGKGAMEKMGKPVAPSDDEELEPKLTTRNRSNAVKKGKSYA